MSFLDDLIKNLKGVYLFQKKKISTWKTLPGEQDKGEVITLDKPNDYESKKKTSNTFFELWLSKISLYQEIYDILPWNQDLFNKNLSLLNLDLSNRQKLLVVKHLSNFNLNELIY